MAPAVPLRSAAPLALLAGLLAACGPAPAAQLAGAPSPSAAGQSCRAEPLSPAPSGLARAIVCVTDRQGRDHRFVAELAESEAEQAQGLMRREHLGPDEAMLFPMNPPRVASFWMHETYIPLDIIFVGPDGRILNIAENARPRDKTPLLSTGTAGSVLEIPGGRVRALGIGRGDRVFLPAS